MITSLPLTKKDMVPSSIAVEKIKIEIKRNIVKLLFSAFFQDFLLFRTISKQRKLKGYKTITYRKGMPYIVLEIES
jgi:hypothetical protein